VQARTITRFATGLYNYIMILDCNHKNILHQCCRFQKKQIYIPNYISEHNVSHWTKKYLKILG